MSHKRCKPLVDKISETWPWMPYSFALYNKIKDHNNRVIGAWWHPETATWACHETEYRRPTKPMDLAWRKGDGMIYRRAPDLIAPLQEDAT